MDDVTRKARSIMCSLLGRATKLHSVVRGKRVALEVRRPSSNGKTWAASEATTSVFLHPALARRGLFRTVGKSSDESKNFVALQGLCRIGFGIRASSSKLLFVREVKNNEKDQ